MLNKFSYLLIFNLFPIFHFGYSALQIKETDCKMNPCKNTIKTESKAPNKIKPIKNQPELNIPQDSEPHLGSSNIELKNIIKQKLLKGNTTEASIDSLRMTSKNQLRNYLLKENHTNTSIISNKLQNSINQDSKHQIPLKSNLGNIDLLTPEE